MSMKEEKSFFRQKVLSARKALSPEERQYEIATLTKRLSQDPRWIRSRTVMLYLSFGNEWDTRPLIQLAWKAHKTVLLPVCLPARQMMPCLFTAETPLISSALGMEEIAPTHHYFQSLECIDLCLIPSVCINPYGERISYGGGYYDRFLPQLPKDCHLLTAGFDCQLLGDPFPTEETDFFIPEVVTPSIHLYTKKRRS